MDIYITGINASGANQKITLPVVPESILYSSETRFAEYEVINKGQILIPDGKNLFDLSWECFFPGAAIRGSRLIRAWTDPNVLDDLFKFWRINGTPLNVCITGTNINADVYLAEYSSTIEGIHIQYEVGFKEREAIVISSEKVKAGVSVKVKKGDTLQKLAKKYLGDKKKYKKIYKANKKLIDKRNKKERKKNPGKKISKYKIYKDQVLVIPTGDTEVIQNDRVEELKRAIKKDGYADLTVNKRLNAAMKAAMKKISIRTGRKGQVVKFVQKMVGTKEDGTCKAKDTAAIKTYQRKKGLTVTGVADYKTLLKMVS